MFFYVAHPMAAFLIPSILLSNTEKREKHKSCYTFKEKETKIAIVPKSNGDICLIFKIKRKVLNELSSISRSNIRSADLISISRSNIRSADQISISRSNIRSAHRITISRLNIWSRDSNSICRSKIRSRVSNSICRSNIWSRDWTQFV